MAFPGSRLQWALIVVLAVLCVAQAALFGFLHLRSGWQREAAGTAVERGRDVAERAGCFGCHGPGGTRPIANPGSVYGEVPDWGDGTWMLWNRNAADVRAWIEDGHPPARPPDAEALIPMPAYAAHLSSAELDDLVAYVLAVSRFGWPDDPLAKEGREIAARMGCFGCHGPEGRGLVRNPGSYRGYIPAWDGEDYRELVRDDDEFRQWVRNGVSDRLGRNPLARSFLERQAIRMPAYGDQLDDEQIGALLAYVRWLRDNPRGED